MTLPVASFGDGDVFLWMLWFFLFIIWFWLLVTVFGDLFRDHETSGWVKAIWIFFIIILPYLGVLVYLIVRGHGMAERQAKQMQVAQAAFDAQVRSVTSTQASPADQIAQAKALLDSGAINQAEFDKLKNTAINS